MKIKITFIEEVLGTASNNPEIHSEFIASNAPDAKSREEEIEAIGVVETIEKSMTVFPRVDGKPVLWDYQIKGFFKDAAGMLSRADGTASSRMTAYKKVVDGLVFVKPRAIFLNLPEGGKIGSCQRPLRGQTAQGERIALANSETVPAGTWIEIDLVYYKIGNSKSKEGPKEPKFNLEDCIREWLDYGELRGIGQWRNSGKGKFTWEEVK